MILKVELLLDGNEEVLGNHAPSIINRLLKQVFIDNSHIAKLIVCDTSVKREHEWRFYMNGTYCINCNQPIGTSEPCK